MSVARVLTPPPFAVAVECDGEQHWVDVIDGVPDARAHDVVSERALGVIGGTLPPCVRAADAVLRAPWQCDRHETWAAEAGGRRPAVQPSPSRVANAIARHPGFFTTRRDAMRSFAEYHGEPEIDTDAIPKVFRRLAVLRNARGKPERVDELVKKFVACTLAEGVGLLGAHLEVGDHPRVGDRDARGRQTIVVPRNWLATVWVFGLERADGRFTLDIEPRDDALDLLQIDQGEDLSRAAIRATIPWPAGIRPIQVHA